MKKEGAEGGNGKSAEGGVIASGKKVEKGLSGVWASLQRPPQIGEI